MKIESITLHHISMPLVAPFETSFGRETDRQCVLITLRAVGLAGYGECVATRDPGYSYETAGTAWHILQDFVAPLILGQDVIDAEDFQKRVEGIRGHHLAKAAVEMALWDLLGKRHGKSLKEMFGGTRDRVDVGVSIGIQESAAALVRTVEAYLEKGYRRIKIKIKPGREVEETFAVRRAYPDLRLQVDANSAYTLETADALKPLDDMDLLLIEQPLFEDDIWDHRKLQAQFKTPICLDESVISPRHARYALEMEACKIINIKPARVAGLSQGIMIHNYCRERNVPVWCGGMLETGVGRASNLALASLPGFILPGDISASDRYYQRDITNERFALNPDSTIDVPNGHGLGVTIDHDALKQFTLSEIAIKAEEYNQGAMPEKKNNQPRKARIIAKSAAKVLLVLMLTSCSEQATTTPLPKITQNTLPITSSVQIATFTPSPKVTPSSDSIPRVYALVAPFPTVDDGVTSDELLTAWSEGTAPPPFNRAPLLMEQSTLAAFTAVWDAPADGAVRVVSSDQLLDEAWSELPSWAVVPFERLEPKWKVLTVDGQSPIRKNFDLSTYPLVAAQRPNRPVSNYDPSKLTTVIMTGVTALVRATALTMELKGATYPGEKIRDLMREADIAHVSNEIPFFTGCTYPKPDQAALVFCSDPKYMDLLSDIGADVIELTGNHFADRGAAGMLETIGIYKKHGLPYFGGGVDLQDSLKPALFEVNGNKIAFIGCNKPDVGRFPTATDFQPGAAPCDFEYLPQKINQLKAQGYVVISTFQWNESYDSHPNPQQIRDFRLMADSGASIVSGSQAHYAQMMEFYDNGFIHYGLGNLFFDQMGDQDWMPRGIRREFFDRYVIYDGKLISVELITALLEDYSRPRLMTERERAGFLQEYFYYSGWIPLNPTLTATITPTLTPMSIPSVSGTQSLHPSSTPKP